MCVSLQISALYNVQVIRHPFYEVYPYHFVLIKNSILGSESSSPTLPNLFQLVVIELNEKYQKSSGLLHRFCEMYRTFS